MEKRPTGGDPGKGRFSVIIVLTLAASMLPEILFRESSGRVPAELPLFRLMALALAGTLAHYLKYSNIAKYALVLGTIVLAEILTKQVSSSGLWQEAFDRRSFAGNFGGSILLKLIGAVPVIGVLLALFKTPAAVYLTRGDLSVKAEAINWLGIKRDTISWGKLALISALLICLGTALLTVLTVTGASSSINADNLLKYFPLVILFAAANSFCEGIVFRSAILGSLRNALSKGRAVFAAALIFGIGHYYGAPSGIVGVVMSSILGWYMSTSMYETQGFAASWLIHFMQDAVIFSTILLLGNYN